MEDAEDDATAVDDASPVDDVKADMARRLSQVGFSEKRREEDQ